MADTDKSSAKRPVSDMVFDRLKEQIACGKWQPGERIPSENALCAELGVSRVSVRAAINRLSGLGLIESRQGEGTYVRAASCTEQLNSMLPFVILDKPDRMNMFEFRKIMEIESVGLAAVRADAETVSQMRLTTRLMRDATTPEKTASFDVEFHYLVAKATKNPIIVKVFEVLRDNYYSLIFQNVSMMGSSGAKYHEMLCNAIEIRDVKLAKQIMEEHLCNTIRVTAGFGKEL